MTITATNLRRSSCHDRADARDATVTIDGTPYEVTMLRDQGSLAIWGDASHWACDTLVQHLMSLSEDDRAQTIAEIEAAVRELPEVA